MQISKNLPQFANQSALIIVAGKQEAAFYLAKDGSLDKVATFVIEKPVYSDPEDFGRRGSQAFRSVGKQEKEKKLIKADFLQNFKTAIKQVSVANPAAVYLFCPATEKAKIQSALPAKLKTKVKMVKEGNFTKEHPFKLLEKIKA